MNTQKDNSMIKDLIIQGMDTLGYTPETLILQGDKKLNSIIAKKITDAQEKDETIKTGFLVAEQNPTETGKPFLKLQLINGNGKGIDGGSLDIKVDFLDHILSPEEMGSVRMMEKLSNFSLDKEIEKLYKSMNLLLQTEMVEQSKKVCVLILVGQGKMNVNLCYINGGNFQPYKKINFADFAKPNLNK